MGYQSKTWSLSDEVVAAFNDARRQGLTPNKYLRQLLGIDPMKAIASDVTRAAQTRKIASEPPARDLLVELDGGGEK